MRGRELREYRAKMHAKLKTLVVILVVVALEGCGAARISDKAEAQRRDLMTRAKQTGSTDTIGIENGRVRATVDIGPQGVSESYYVMDGGKPRLVAKSAAHAGLSATCLAAETDTGDRTHVAPDYSALGKQVVEGKLKMEDLPPWPQAGPNAPVCPIMHKSHSLRGTAGAIQKLTLMGETESGDKIERTILLGSDDDFFRIEVTMASDRALSLERFVDRYNFSPSGAPDLTWLPQLKRSEDNLCADWSFKSPAAIMQKDDLMFALVPDPKDLKSNGTWKMCTVALDMDVRTKPGPTISYGFVPSIPDHHSLFKHVPGQRAITRPGKTVYSYFLLLGSDVPERQAHRPVVSFLWERFGHDALLEGHAAQKFSFAAWEKKTWHEFADAVWFECERNGIPCGAFRCGIFGMTKDAWFCGWWNNLRTAYGLELYSRRSGDEQAHERAIKILNLALDAPRNEGAFPVLFHIEPDGDHWERDHQFGGYIDCYHTFDMSWTSYWLLRWYDNLKPSDERSLPYCVAYGDFLLKHQQPSGFIPSYFKQDLTLRQETRLNVESAEPAACAVFLVELYKTVGDRKYLDAAIKAMEYMQREIIPKQKWFDYETFLSCSPKPYDFYDPITAQEPQNNMGTIQAAQALLALYDVTHEQRFLEWGMNALDYLSLTQQVWSHPAMTPNLIGGFTTQNSDAEWSDAREAYCAIVYLDYFERCGKLEYLERGIAALRSSFPVAPYENWAHVGFLDAPGALSGFHWGQGSGMASVEMVWDRYGDVVVDLAGRWAYGINGCTVQKPVTDGQKVMLEIQTDLKWDEPARIVFRRVPAGDYNVVINRRHVGRFNSSDLLSGIDFSFAP